MSKALLARFVKMVLEDKKARVPNQLMGGKHAKDEEKDESEVEDVKEFSGVGAIAGFTAPLGMGAEDLQPHKSKKKHWA